MDFYNTKNFSKMSQEFIHEVKNPVALINATIDYMQISDKNGVYSKSYGVIKKELQKITSIVKDFIKNTSPFQATEKEVIFIYDLISEVIDEFTVPYGQQKIKFDLNCDDKDLKIFGEYSKICIVFFNIFKNAIEAIKDNGTIVSSITKGGDYITIQITDDGEGIKESLEESVGTPFFTTKDNGTGLGLSICHQIVESHNGTFRIFNNESKKGCTVEISIKAI